MKNPIVEYSHELTGGCTVVGGFVYRGSIYPNMMGKYFYVDYCSGMFSTIYKVVAIWHNEPLAEDEPYQYVTFGEDMYGELYVADIAEGEIYKLIDTTVMRMAALTDDPNTVLFPNPTNGHFDVKWIANENETCNIEIVNTFGQQIYSATTAAIAGINTWSYTNSSLFPDSYIFVIKTNKGAIRKQFIVNI